MLGVSGINVKKKGWEKMRKNSKVPKPKGHSKPEYTLN